MQREPYHEVTGFQCLPHQSVTTTSLVERFPPDTSTNSAAGTTADTDFRNFERLKGLLGLGRLPLDALDWHVHGPCNRCAMYAVSGIAPELNKKIPHVPIPDGDIIASYYSVITSVCTETREVCLPHDNSRIIRHHLGTLITCV